MEELAMLALGGTLYYGPRLRVLLHKMVVTAPERRRLTAALGPALLEVAGDE
ncbi:hypothetical protein GCM10020001_119700 [Nonomuraea salmonea]